MSKIEFGIRIPNSGPLTSPANLIRAAREAEALGFDAAWVHDHLAWTPYMHRYHVSCGAVEAVRDEQTPDFLESLMVLSHVAAVTERINLGVAVVVLPARNPVILAKQWATLDVLAGGRTIFGIGMGSPASLGSDEFAASGYPRQGRAKRMDEFTEVLRAVWEQEVVNFEGEFVQLKEAWIHPKPLQKPSPPIWVGGGTEFAIRRAARIADGWIPGWRTPEEMKQGTKLLAEEAEKHGRNPKMPVGIEVMTSVASDRQTAFDRGSATVLAGLKSYERTFDTGEAALAQCIFGSMDDAKRQVEAFIDGGVTHFELRFIYSTMDQLSEQLELWAKHIMPAYR
jgi:probable F420-dependent oxidoreductase